MFMVVKALKSLLLLKMFSLVLCSLRLTAKYFFQNCSTTWLWWSIKELFGNICVQNQVDQEKHLAYPHVWWKLVSTLKIIIIAVSAVLVAPSCLEKATSINNGIIYNPNFWRDWATKQRLGLFHLSLWYLSIYRSFLF